MWPPRTGSRVSVDRLERATVRSSARTLDTAGPAPARPTSRRTMMAERFIPRPFSRCQALTISGELGIARRLGRTLAVEEYVEVLRLRRGETRQEQLVEDRPDLGRGMRRQERGGQCAARLEI